MTENRRAGKLSRTFVCVCAALALMMTLTAAAYAADLGGFRQAVTLWLAGEERTGTMQQVEDGKFVFLDEQGRENYFAGMVTEDGVDRPMTMDELLNDVEMEPHAYVVDGEDGSVWLCYRDQKVDITEKVANGAVARVKLDNEGTPLYVTVAADGPGSYSLSEGMTGYADEATLFPDGD